MTITGITVTLARYVIENRKLTFECVAGFTLGGTPSTIIYMTLPYLAAFAANYIFSGAAFFVDAGGGGLGLHRIDVAGTRTAFIKPAFANWIVGAGASLNLSGYYEI